jgi:glycosyltransferase involved in cell wall biosynthesis
MSDKNLISIPSIGLLGPVLPYRGGIAQHTTMLHRTLKEKVNLISLSFIRQYPLWLYPGKSNFDPSYENYKEREIIYLLDPLNPFSWISVCNHFIKHECKMVIIPWWSIFWTVCLSFIARYLKYKGIKVMFLCHNIIEHEPKIWKKLLTKEVLSAGDYFLVHTEKDGELIKTLLNKDNIIICPHPLYNQFPPGKGYLPRRARLELLFFGFVRHYKGLDILFKSMELLKEEDIFLTVAGEWWTKDENLKKFLNASNNKIEIIDTYITEEETAEYFTRADVVVLPYRSASGSGVVSVAYHYNKPVIATKVGGFPDVVKDGISGRLISPEDPCELAMVIREFLYKPSLNMSENIKKISEDMTWHSFTEKILKLCYNSS